MKKLGEYLEFEFKDTTKRIAELCRAVEGISKLLVEYYNETPNRDREYAGWPYAVNGKDYKPILSKRGSYSVATVAMCCESAECILEAGLITDRKVETGLRACADRAIKSLWLSLELSVKKEKFWSSSTFGANDPFTASWLSFLCNRRTNPPSAQISGRINGLLIRRRKELDKSLFRVKRNEAGPHALPLLKNIQAIASFGTGNREDIFEESGKWFEKNLHRQMSFYRFEDYRFDAAELIFCLHGALKTEAVGCLDSIVPKVLNIIREAQGRSVYWRPYRPMLFTPQGQVLLPLSIEVATSLLEVLKDTNLFEEYQDTLNKFFSWLMTQKVAKNSEPKWIGWHSENAYETDDVHVWQSAVIGRFLSKYLLAQENLVQEKILSSAKFTVKRPEDIKEDLIGGRIVAYDLGINDPDQIREIQNSFLGSPQKRYSMLLYGPPGTSKTTIAEALAKSKEWPLVYLSPSDFIADGPSEIESRAKLIFKALCALRNTVIFFDEIDQMILDRDSQAYKDQDDLFKFMTPGMLTKLSDLRKTERNIFIIGTNYAERIDPAIKREGRIDINVLCFPYFGEARKKILKVFIDNALSDIYEDLDMKTIEDWDPSAIAILEALAKSTHNNVYEELRRWVNSSLPSSGSYADIIDLRIKILNRLKGAPPPVLQITLGSYERRLKDKDGYTNQKPYEEFLKLLINEGEVKQNNDVKNKFIETQKQWKLENSEDYDNKYLSIFQMADKCNLSSWHIDV